MERENLGGEQERSSQSEESHHIVRPPAGISVVIKEASLLHHWISVGMEEASINVGPFGILKEAHFRRAPINDVMDPISLLFVF